MAEEQKTSSLLRLALGAGILAAAAVGVVIFVPRRRWQLVTAPLKDLAATPAVAAMTAWAINLWDDMTAPTPPVFDDLRPFDEF